MSLDTNTYFLLASSQLFPFTKDISSTIASDIEAIQYAQDAYAALQKGDMKEALNIYNAAIEKFPEQPFFYACRAIVYHKEGDDESAFYNYQSAKRLDFNYHHYMEWLENRGDMLESEELKDLTGNLGSDAHAQSFINRAMMQVQHFNYQEAIADYTRAFMLTNQSDILVSRAAIYQQLLQYDKALEDLNEALLQQPSVEGYIYRAKLYMVIRERALAFQDFEAAIALNPTASRIYEERAQLFEQQSDYEKALTDYSEMVRLNADDFYVYVLRGDAYEKVEKWEEAIEDYSKAIALNPYYSDLYQYRGTLREKIGDIEGAEADYAKFEELEGEDDD